LDTRDPDAKLAARDDPMNGVLSRAMRRKTTLAARQDEKEREGQAKADSGHTLDPSKPDSRTLHAHSNHFH